MYMTGVVMETTYLCHLLLRLSSITKHTEGTGKTVVCVHTCRVNQPFIADDSYVRYANNIQLITTTPFPPFLLTKTVVLCPRIHLSTSGLTARQNVRLLQKSRLLQHHALNSE